MTDWNMLKMHIVNYWATIKKHQSKTKTLASNLNKNKPPNKTKKRCIAIELSLHIILKTIRYHLQEPCWVEDSWLYAFFFITFKYLVTPFWPAEFLLKNQLIALWELTWMLFVSFSLLLLISLFIFNCFHFDYSISWYFPFWFIPCGTLCFLDLGDCFLSQIREVFSYYVFKYVLSAPPLFQSLVELL